MTAKKKPRARVSKGSVRVLVVYHFEGNRLGLVERALEEVGAEIRIWKPFLNEPVPAGPEYYDGLVVLGGMENALADDKCPWLPDLCRLMRAFADADRSVLGICLGSQLLAREYGGCNIVGGASELGWKQLHLTPEGKDDPIFAGLPTTFPVFQWHDDTFTLPPGVGSLASTREVRNQGFRIGRAVYSLQCHFEADRRLVEIWNDNLADWIAAHRPEWLERHPAEAARLGPKAEAAGLTIARNWVQTIDVSRRK